MEIALPIIGKSAASFMIGKLMTATTSYMEEQYLWKRNLEAELDNLRNLLPRIEAVVDFAERRTITDNESLVKWLWQLRDGIDEAEEVIDDLEYIRLEKKANSDKTKIFKVVDASIRIAKRVLNLDDVLPRLRQCVRKLSSIPQNVGDFLAYVRQCPSTSDENHLHPLPGERTYTTSLPESTLGSTSFVGRGIEKQTIIQILMEESESNGWNVGVLPLVGMGGIGKTTLAQQVYNHFENVKHFDTKGWVCVSTDFNADVLAKKIYESLVGSKPKYANIDILHTKLREKLQDKKFLLVLDDAWNDSKKTGWEKLCAPLHRGRKGSWILLTTRWSSVVKKVSEVMKGTIQQRDVVGLSKDECRSLLYQHAFGNEDPDAYPRLTGVGEEIIDKLHGVPLLAKTIGGVLSSKLEEEHWRRVSDELWKMAKDSKDDFIPALRLSYDMLSSMLKRCFAYCSIFPQDHLFEKEKLVNMWIAAGLIQAQQSEGLEEDIPGQCFDELCTKSLFDAHPKYQGYYVMHDMLHGLACHVSRHECRRIMREQDIPRTIRHLSINCTFDELPERMKMVGELRHLRTFRLRCTGHQKERNGFIEKASTFPRSIRVLVIEADGNISEKWWLNNIRNLVHLRLLELPSYFPPKVAESFSRFYFLQVLDTGDENFKPPSGMNKLINLKHFYTSNHPYREMSRIFKVGNLTRLQELDSYKVGTKNGYRIDELKDMNDLRCLGISGLGNIRSFEEATLAKLQMKKKLNSLTLSWSNSETENRNPEHDNQVLAALNPPPSIRELSIENYEGDKSAPWMTRLSLCSLEILKIDSCPSWGELPLLWQLPNLKYLHLERMNAVRKFARGCWARSLCSLESLKIYSCRVWGELPPLWELPQLKHLYLSDMDAVRRFGSKSPYSNGVDKPLFPSLEELQLRRLPHFQEWDDADDYIWFPRLKELEIEDCPELKKIPCVPSSLQRRFAPGSRALSLCSLESLKIYSSGVWGELPPLWELPQLKHLYLSDMDAAIRFGPKSPYSNGVDKPLFPSLEELQLRRLPHFQEWDDADDYIWFPRLKELEIEDCPELKKIPCLPSSLQRFIIRRVGLTSLPRSYKTHNDTRTPGRFRELMSLELLEIDRCPEIIPREPTGEEDGNLLPSSLIELRIFHVHAEGLCNYLQGLIMLSDLKLSDCGGMVELPPAGHLTALQYLLLHQCNDLVSLGGLHSMTWLWNLEIEDCPKLLEDKVDTQHCPNNLLPPSLTGLDLTGCNVSHESLSLCLLGLTSLRSLRLHNCPKISSLPGAVILRHLIALDFLYLSGCEELQEVESLGALHSLETLWLDTCPKLLAAASSTEQPCWPRRKLFGRLQRIKIESMWYLLMLPVPMVIVSVCVDGNHPHTFNEIPKMIMSWLLDCSWSLQDLDLGRVPCLETLPESLIWFSSLKSLRLRDASQLKSLTRMPASLESLCISGCNPSLKKRCQKNVGDDWPNIKHIPEISIYADESDPSQVICGSWSFSRLYKTACFANNSTA